MSKADELTKMKALLDTGVLTNDEFERQKQQLLSSDSAEATIENPSTKPRKKRKIPTVIIVLIVVAGIIGTIVAGIKIAEHTYYMEAIEMEEFTNVNLDYINWLKSLSDAEYLRALAEINAIDNLEEYADELEAAGRSDEAAEVREEVLERMQDAVEKY
jgi:hypothetical protein